MRPGNRAFARTIAVAALLILGATGCSRLTFIKPNLKRHDYRQVAPDYNIRDDARDAGRVAALDRVALAEQQVRAGHLDEAETEAQAAVKADPQSADGYTLLGIIEDQRGHAAQAGSHYAKAVALAPARGAILNNYGTWLCANGKAADSLALFDRALADPGYPTPATALANAGACALTAGQSARAQRNLAHALELDPANPVALEAMAQTEYGAGHFLDARAFSERRLAAAPPNVQVLQLASQIEQKLGDTAAAARYVRRIETEFPPARADSTGDSSRK